MGRIRQLAGQTAIYGVSNILGRIFNYLLVPFYTRVFIPSEFGTITEFYAYASFLAVILTYGMETAFFRYSENETDKDRVYSTSLISLIFSSAIFILIISLFSHNIANTLRYPDHNEYITWFAMILALDAITSIPFAKLRAQNKAFRFASLKFIFIILNVGLNVFFLLICPYIYKHHTPVAYSFVSLFFNGNINVGYVFIANLISSLIILILLLPEIINIKYSFDRKLWKRMLAYAWPLLIAGLAGMGNETGDRILLKYLLPQNVALSQLGIYGACYKISILLTLFILAFRFAAEPFFFAHAKETDSKKIYSTVMNYFVIIVSAIFLVVMLYIDVVMYFVGEKFRIGKPVVPILLFANLCLGIYYNLSIWYKLTNRTGFGALLSIVGFIITIALNFWGIPRFGYIASAWTTLFCYASMMILSYLIGQKYYHINYNLKRISVYLGLTLLLYFMSIFIHPDSLAFRLTLNTFFMFIYITIVLFIEKPPFIFGRLK